MTTDSDGIALMSRTHPRAPLWKRLWHWVRPPQIAPASLETVTIRLVGRAAREALFFPGALAYCRQRLGDADNLRTPAENLEHVRSVLKPAVTDLAHALGVSRQAIYDWQSGKPLTAQNAARLADLARAADVFAAEKLTGSAQILRRPIVSGMRLIDVVRDGGSAENAAKKLVEMVRRELRQRQALSARLEGRKRPPTSSDDLAAPFLNEVS